MTKQQYTKIMGHRSTAFMSEQTVSLNNEDANLVSTGDYVKEFNSTGAIPEDFRKKVTNDGITVFS